MDCKYKRKRERLVYNYFHKEDSEKRHIDGKEPVETAPVVTELLNAANSALYKCFRQFSVRSVHFSDLLFSCSIKCVRLSFQSVFPSDVSPPEMPSPLVYAGRRVDVRM